MQTFSKNNYDLFKYLCRLDQMDLLQFLTAYLNKTYDKVTSTEDYVFAEGDIPVCLIAHLDTVFDKRPSEIYYDREAGVIWSPQGLGADDRAGVFAIISIIQGGQRPHIVFTTDEEIGGFGATFLTYDYPICPFEKCNYIIELDRQGANDAVFYNCINQEFIKFIESCGFCETIGIYSDIVEIAPEWGLSAVNLSVGYFDEHSEIERLRVPLLIQTIKKAQKMLLLNTPMFKWEGPNRAENMYDRLLKEL